MIFPDIYTQEIQLPSTRIPDRSRRLIIHPLAPYRVGIVVVVDGNPEIVAERETEAFLADVAIASDIAGEAGLVRPGRAAVRGTAVVGIPVRPVASVHPSHSHVAGAACDDCGEGMLDSACCRRQARLWRSEEHTSELQSPVHLV